MNKKIVLTCSMIVLSLFDGMSCGQIALIEAGIKFDKYYASETDKFAIRQTQHNFPNTIQLGDIKNVRVRDLPKIDLVIGGSPCQGFSFAGKQLKFDDPRSVLFFEYVRILNEIKKINPEVKFLLENVNMKKNELRIISEYLGVFPVNINSNLVSAQNRNRWYWTNIRLKKVGLFDEIYTDIPQPKDKGILLKDILQPENEIDKKYYLEGDTLKRLLKENPKINPDKAYSVTPNSNTVSGGRSRQGSYIKLDKKGNNKSDQNKVGCLTGGGHSGGNHSDMDVLLIQRAHGFNKGGIYTEKSPTITGHSWRDNNHIAKDYKLRRLTSIECSRLQTVPESYEWIVSDTQMYKMLGNGWTCAMISHIFSFLK